MSWRAGLARFTKAVTVLALFSVAANFAMSDPSGADITLGPPSADTINVGGSAAFTAQLGTPSGNNSNPVTFVATEPSSPPGLTVNGSGDVSTTGVLAANTYTVSGTDNDSPGTDVGTWNYSLTVTADPITQGSPSSNAVSVANSATFADTLSATSPNSNTVTFVATEPSSPPGLTVNGSGDVSTTGALAATTYMISGTDTDSFNDVGTWNYSLTVNPNVIVQGSPISGSTTTTNSATFADTLSATSPNSNTVTFVATEPSSPPGLTVNGSGDVSTTGVLAATTYMISGTDTDSFNDVGTWNYSLSVTPAGGGSGGSGGTTILQTSSTTGSVPTTSSGTFAPGPITVDKTGPVTFVTTKASSALSVSSSGSISTTGPLSAGTYTVSGTDSDVAGDHGTWTFTLTVTAVAVDVTFDANGGSGEMASQSESQPTALSLNTFRWPGHTFLNWNTSANGTGVSYANGAVFPFSGPTTLFAQWKTGKAPTRTVTFEANGGTGIMATEADNTPTALSANRFSRTGYTFANWDTVANGKGKRFGAGATYSFNQSVILFAQWKKIPARPVYVVTFLANGGVGTMAPQRDRAPAALTPNRFTRAGFTFLNWNMAANGTGVSLANGATYSFSGSITVYAQWKKIKKITPPPPKRTGPVVGPFALKASQLTSSLDAQATTLADDMRADGDSQVTLLGYGDELSAKDAQNKALVAKNIELGRMRAQAVATYLEGLLTSLHLKGWTISISGASVLASTSYNAGEVIATLS